MQPEKQFLHFCHDYVRGSSTTKSVRLFFIPLLYENLKELTETQNMISYKSAGDL